MKYERSKQLLTAVIATLLASAATLGHADELAELKERLDAQEQQIKILERKLELNDEAAKATASSAGVVRASALGSSVQSADGAN